MNQVSSLDTITSVGELGGDSTEVPGRIRSDFDASTQAGGDVPDVPQDGSKHPLRLGRFAILGVLGEGGIGRVYSGFDDQLDRRVALKVLRRSVDEAARARMLREAQAMAKLSHPNVLPVFEVGETDGVDFIAMEFVRGQTLKDWQSEGERTWAEILAVYLQAGEGLAAAHAAGFIHRDFKPHNVMIDDPGGRARARVLDFGLVQLDEDDLETTDQNPVSLGSCGSAPSAKITRTGALLGTPAYMAPEQFSGSEVTAAADQFSFCVALWEALYGERPFCGDTLAAQVGLMLSGRSPALPPRSPVPRRIREVLRRGLSVDPAQRWPSMRVLVDGLRPDRHSRRRGWLSLGATLVVVGLAVSTAVSGRAEQPPCDPDAALGDVWSSARRSGLQAHTIAVTDPAYDTWSPIARAFDEYTEQWRHEYDAAVCHAADPDSEQAARQKLCLADAKTRMNAFVNNLEGAEPMLLRESGVLLGRLGSPSDCTGDAPLTGVAPPKPSEREAVTEISRIITTSWARRIAFHPDESLELAQQAHAAAARLEYAPVQARAGLALSESLRELYRYDEARAAAEAAMKTAAMAEDLVSMHSLSIELMQVELRSGRPEAARKHWPLAIGLARSSRARSASYYVRGMLRINEGRYEDAEADLRLSLQFLGEGPQEARLRAGRLTQIAQAQRLMKRYREAERNDRQARREMVTAAGPSALALANIDRWIGEDLRYQHDVRGALALFLSVEDRYRRSPENVPRFLLALQRSITALTRVGAYDEAETRDRERVELLQRREAPKHELALAVHSLSVVLESQGRMAEARKASLQAFELLRDAENQDLLRASVTTILSITALAQGDLDAAEAGHERALEVRESALPRDHIHTAYSVHGLAEVALARGDTHRAVELAERAWSIREHDLRVLPRRRADTAFVLARALYGEGDKVRARRLAEEAVGSYMELGRAHDREIASIADWLQEHD